MYLYAVKKMSIRPYKEEEVTERLRNPETQRAAFGEVVEAYGEKLYWQIRKMVLSRREIGRASCRERV